MIQVLLSEDWKVFPVHSVHVLIEFTIWQAKSSSMVQLLEQPSPEIRLELSHYYPLLTIPSPHAKMQKLLTIMYPISHDWHVIKLEVLLLLQVVQLGPIAAVHYWQLSAIKTYPVRQLRQELVPPPLQVRQRVKHSKAV
jgi:hypothetical protein